MRVSSVCRQPPSERDVEDFDPRVVHCTNTQGPAVCKIISPRKDPGNKVSFSKKISIITQSQLLVYITGLKIMASQQTMSSQNDISDLTSEKLHAQVMLNNRAHSHS